MSFYPIGARGRWVTRDTSLESFVPPAARARRSFRVGRRAWRANIVVSTSVGLIFPGLFELIAREVSRDL